MKNFIGLLLGVLFLLTSCTEEPSIEGIWMGLYKKEMGKAPYEHELNILLDISSDEIIVKNFIKDLQYDIDTISITPYKLKDSAIYIADDTLYISKLKNEELEFIVHRNTGDIFKWGFTRLRNPKQETTIHLVDKVFALEGNNITDTFDFLNDSVFIYIDNNAGVKPWTTSNYKGLNFIVMGEWFKSVYLVDSVVNTDIHLSAFYQKIIPFKLSPLAYKKDTTGLLGNWVFPYNEMNLGSVPPPPPPPPGREGKDYMFYLDIGSDTINNRIYGLQNKNSFRLNTTHEYIYFEKGRRGYELLKIYSLDSTVLVIDKPTGFYRYFGKEKTARFERIQK